MIILFLILSVSAGGGGPKMAQERIFKLFFLVVSVLKICLNFTLASVHQERRSYIVVLHRTVGTVLTS